MSTRHDVHSRVDMPRAMRYLIHMTTNTSTESEYDRIEACEHDEYDVVDWHDWEGNTVLIAECPDCDGVNYEIEWEDGEDGGYYAAGNWDVR